MEAVTSNHIGIFIGCLGVLIALALGLKQLLQRDPPLHREFASKEQFKELEKKFEDEMRDLRKERSTSTANLHARIEKFDAKNQQITESLKAEIKKDVEGVQSRITDLFGAFKSLQGGMNALLKSSRNPFDENDKV